MSANKDRSHSKWRSVARKVVCGASAAGMCLAMLPATAFATDITSKYYALPGANSVQSFEHHDTGHGHDYTYRYITVGGSSTGRVAPMMETWYETLGLNYTDAYNGPATIFGRSKVTGMGLANERGDIDKDYTDGTQGSLTTRNASLAIEVATNSNPDEYIRNYCAWANGATVPVDSRALDHGNVQGAGSVGSYSVSVGGTEYQDFPREVYMECDLLGASMARLGDGISDYQKWVDLENQRENRPKTGKYDPKYLKLNMNTGGGAAMVNSLGSLAKAVDGVVADSKDSNGNYTLQTRYAGNTSDGTQAVVSKVQDVVQASQYYTLSRIANGQVKKATTAVLVGYDPKTGNYACRKYSAGDFDPNGNQYGGRVANYLADISNSITSKGLKPAQKAYNDAESKYVVWYTPEQIVANADVVFGCDAPSSNKISTYLATSSDGEAHTVYAPKGASTAEEDNTDAFMAAYNKAVKAKKHAARYCFSYPANMFGNFYAQGMENAMLGPITCAVTYPKLFSLNNLLAYWTKNVWHVKAGSVADIVNSTTSGMDSDVLGTLSNNYEAEAQRIFEVGNQYYLKHRAAVNKINGGNLETDDYKALEARTPNGLIEGEKASVSAGTVRATSGTAVTFTKAKSKTTISVPATVKVNGKTYKVTKVAKNAFTGSKVKNVTLGSNVKTVNGKAFNDAKNLKKVTLGTGVTKLSKSAFYKTPKLKTITVKSKGLTKKSAVKNALKGSKIAKKLTVKHSGVSKKQLKKSFTQKNLGAPVKVVVK